MQQENISWPNVNGTVPLRGDVSVELGVVVVPLEGVEVRVPHVVDAAEGCRTRHEGKLRHVQRPQEAAGGT